MTEQIITPPNRPANKAAPSLGTIVWLSIRPKTLGAAIAPILVGSALAYQDNGFFWPAALAALTGALLIQIGTNLANDYYDYIKGADAERIGPTRVTQAGWLSPHTIRTAWIAVFGLAALIGCGLIWRGGWPILLIGILSIASGILYTGGPYPLGYNGLGDLFAFVFFGPIAVAGTYYVQTLQWSWVSLWLGAALGFLSTAMITINNLRDTDTDAKVGKRTLSVRWGRRFAQWEYTFCWLATCIIIAGVAWYTRRFETLLTLLSILPAIPALRAVWNRQDGPSLNQALAQTGQSLLLFSVLFAVTWSLS